MVYFKNIKLAWLVGSFIFSNQLLVWSFLHKDHGRKKSRSWKNLVTSYSSLFLAILGSTWLYMKFQTFMDKILIISTILRCFFFFLKNNRGGRGKHSPKQRLGLGSNPGIPVEGSLGDQWARHWGSSYLTYRISRSNQGVQITNADPNLCLYLSTIKKTTIPYVRERIKGIFIRVGELPYRTATTVFHALLPTAAERINK